jgi:hypothetical protein
VALLVSESPDFMCVPQARVGGWSLASRLTPAAGEGLSARK